jgi:hypothetical protein
MFYGKFWIPSLSLSIFSNCWLQYSIWPELKFPDFYIFLWALLTMAMGYVYWLSSPRSIFLVLELVSPTINYSFLTFSKQAYMKVYAIMYLRHGKCNNGKIRSAARFWKRAIVKNSNQSESTKRLMRKVGKFRDSKELPSISKRRKPVKRGSVNYNNHKRLWYEV